MSRGGEVCEHVERGCGMFGLANEALGERDVTFIRRVARGSSCAAAAAAGAAARGARCGGRASSGETSAVGPQRAQSLANI